MFLGGEGGWDYLTVDSAAKRLYISHATHVMVVDLSTYRLAGDIPDTPGVHGIAVAPELNRGFTSNGSANTSTIFDLKTLKALGTVKTGTNPDCILYDPPTKRVFTFNGGSGDATVFDAATGTIVGTVVLGGKPETARSDGKGTIYVNIESTNEVVSFDAVKLSVVKRYPLKPGEGPTGMGLDIAHSLAYCGCSNRIITVLDLITGRVIATIPIGEGVDGNAFDPSSGIAFSSNGDGTLSVVQRSSQGRFQILQTLPTERGARTMTIDPVTHTVYLPASSKNGFELLVIEK
jgi:DNA-binding beta-propeller fold protein YncE